MTNKRIVKTSGWLLLGTAWLLSACVTINIYFPAAAAEEAAGRIVEDVLGKRPAEERPAPPQGDKGTQIHRTGGWLAALVDFVIPTAHAASPDFNIDTPAIRQIRARMKGRHEQLKPFYSSGAAGFANDGLIAARDAGAVGVRDRTRFNKLLAEENKDRNALYREIAKANGHPEWEPEVRGVFARQWVEQARSGWWVQNASGGWRKK